MREADPTATNLLAVDRQLRDVDRQQRNLIDQLANLGGNAATLVAEKLNALDGQRQRLDEERAEIQARQSAWLAAQARIADIRAWCQRVAKKIDSLTYAEKRETLVALDVRMLRYRAGHVPSGRSRRARRLGQYETAPCVWSIQ